MLSTYCVNETSVVSEIIDGEVIMLNLDNGRYYTANPSGALVWSLLSQGQSLGDIVLSVAVRFEVEPTDIEPQTKAFIEHLSQEGLVRRSQSEQATSAPTPAKRKAKVAYEPPHLMVFSDMEALLLLDPIHQVNEHGWPHANKRTS